MTAKYGVLLINIGTPAAPTPKAVRQYLKKFLSDPHVVKIPRLIWWPILYGIILPFRSKSSALLYQQIWTPEGSPLLINTQRIAAKLENFLQAPVQYAMQYSEPTIKTSLAKLRNQAEKIIVLPLYPQYSETTTLAALDTIKSLNVTALQCIENYFDYSEYIQAICHSIETTWKTRGKAQHLLFSFHGIPERYIQNGDPYLQQCQRTVELITQQLQLDKSEWTLSFQSRLGKAKWLSPYTDTVLQALPGRWITDVQVICPGFPADCLETLEEIAIRGKKQFLAAGGKNFYYIQALNDSAEHIAALAEIVKSLAFKSMIASFRATP